MLEEGGANRENEELECGSRQQIIDYYYLKYHHDHAFVIGDKNLRRNIEVMIGKQNLYCTFHDTRNVEPECEHIKFIKMLNEIQN
ncbi:MAG TPA: hypothetical protein VD815_05465 [Candidatus Saccharimonadales bacterium]|nr:hypothetical protein [Candidatus Saccharimonadales bacterium]